MQLSKFRDNNLALAGGLAVIAAVLTMIYVAQSGGGATEPAAAAGQPLATVYVAKKDIPVGTAGAALFRDGYVEAKRVATGAVAPAAITDRRQVTGLVAVQPLYSGEQLTDRRFGQTGATGVLSDLHGVGRVIQLAGDAQQLLAGMLKPGDHVDVVVSMKGPDQTSALGRIVLRNLLVVNVSGSKDSSTTTGSSVTLQVTDREARTLFFVVKNGDWSLVLRPLVRPQNSPDGVVSTASVMAGRS